MEGASRRDTLISILKSKQGQPISGTELAKELKVSRQVIVQDIALLRVANYNILSTTKGYLLYSHDSTKANRCFTVKHSTAQIEEELNTIVDCGGKVLDVIVLHDIYGEIRTDLIIANRSDVKDFMKKVKQKETTPLKELTNGLHLHTVEADREDILDKIEMQLREKGFLVEK